jgi:DNA-binding NtrC family response regulator
MRKAMSKKHVLLVEDDLHVQKALRRVLNENMITAYTTVEEAITALSDITFDVVITNFRLAGPKTGEDLIRWLSANRPEMLAKTILFTGDIRAMNVHTRVILKPAMGELRTALSYIR